MTGEHPPDVGLSHVALPVADVDRSIDFYERYADMKVVHDRTDPRTGIALCGSATSRARSSWC